MRRRSRTYLLLAGAGFVEVVLLLNLLWPLPGEEDSGAWVGGLMAFPVAAALILVHRPENGVGRAMGVVSVSAAVIFVFTWYALTYEQSPLSRPAEAIGGAAVMPQFGGMIALLHLFPSGGPTGSLHRGVFRAFAGLYALMTLLAFQMSPLSVTGRSNPLEVIPLPDDADVSLVFLLLGFALTGVWSLVLRWRRAGATERAQLKWFLCAAVAVLVMLVMILTAEENSDDLSDSIAGVFVAGAFWSLPTAVVVAVLRYRLYDIDRIINRTLVYALLTATLAAIYLGLVVGLQALLAPLSGGSDLAIALTTLAVAALFLPARSRIQRTVDRRFNRRAYDAARTIEAFSARLREQIDLDTLRDEVVAVIDETMQPAQASVWLRPQEQSR